MFCFCTCVIICTLSNFVCSDLMQYTAFSISIPAIRRLEIIITGIGFLSYCTTQLMKLIKKVWRKYNLFGFQWIALQGQKTVCSLYYYILCSKNITIAILYFISIYRWFLWNSRFFIYVLEKYTKRHA